MSARDLSRRIGAGGCGTISVVAGLSAPGTDVSGMNEDGDSVASKLSGPAGRWWGLDVGEADGLSKSHNTTVLRPDLGVVVRVYRPGVSVERVAALQAARRALGDAGVPVVPLIPSQWGGTVEAVNGRVVEVEEYVEHDGRMNTPPRLLRGAVLLAGVHDALADLHLGPEGDHCPDANWISPVDVASSVGAGVDRIRGWGDPANRDLIDTALRLADLVSEAEAPPAAGGAGQLVHGDFWDDNVYVRGEKLVAVADLDFMGNRPRVDDLALTLYFTDEEMQLAHAADRPAEERIATLRPLVRAYAAALSTPLSEAEWQALPWALARQPLWGIGKWVRKLPSEAQAKEHARATGGAVRRAITVAADANRWLAGLRGSTAA
jgi:Ser/Thr protein kinase RdoA (MazF antagonist)